MSEFPLGYEKIAPTTWVYLSSLLMLGLFFKFNRAWSLRNVDLLLLILLAPGLLMVVLGENLAETSIPVTGDPPAQLRAETGDPPDVVPPTAPDDLATPPLTTSDPRQVAPGLEAELPAELTDDTPGSQEDFLAGASDADFGSPDSPADESSERTVDDGSLDARRLQLAGYIWLFSVGVLFVTRMLFDPMMTRRPLLEPNLSTGGLIFLGCSLFFFLMMNVITSRPTQDDLEGPLSAVKFFSGSADEASDDSLTRHGPGYRILFLLPSVPTVAMSNEETVVRAMGDIRTWTIGPEKQQIDAHYLGTTRQGEIRLRQSNGEVYTVDRDNLSAEDRSQIRILAACTVIAKTMAILSHLAVVIGIVLVGHYHFDKLSMGVGAATLYLMLPYTAQMTGRVDHVIPAALMIWAIFFYRRPLAAGMFIGLAAGAVYYPLFLLPLWVSFYWHRGLMRFTLGVVSMLLILALSLVFVSSDLASFLGNIQKMFGIWLPVRQGLEGIWGLGWDPNFRLPVLVGFITLSGTFAIWPGQKNLGTLLSCSAALMVATQFWHGFGGGLYMAWYLPLALLTIFRPNLEDRIALTVLGEGWLSRRHREHMSRTNMAAFQLQDFLSWTRSPQPDRESR